MISTLERDVADLKKEISERDGTIQDKEKRIYELKRKKQELEKYKFVLNFKITELKNQVSIYFCVATLFCSKMWRNLYLIKIVAYIMMCNSGLSMFIYSKFEL